MTKNSLLSGVIIDEAECLTFEEFCQAIRIKKDVIMIMIEYRVFQPQGTTPQEWKFDSACLRRGRIAASFYHDLEVNLPGVALALQLLDEIENLQRKIAVLPKVHPIDDV